MKGLENTLRRTLGLSIPSSKAGEGSDSEPTRTFFFSLIVFRAFASHSTNKWFFCPCISH